MQIDILRIMVFLGLAVICLLYWTISHREKNRLLKIPIGLFILYLLINAFVPIFDAAHLKDVSSSLSTAGAIVLWMAVIRIIVFFIVDYFLRHKRGLEIPTITRDFALAILYIVAAMIVLKHETNVNLGSILTTSAILTAVIGFAMQDTLGNLFSGLALQIEHPYQIGDWIGFEGIEGKVVGITWKSTKLLTRSEEMIFVPNNTIAKSRLTNFSRPTPKHITSLEIGASYNDPPHKVRKAVTETILDHPKVLPNHPPLVLVSKYDNFSINYKAFFATEDIATEGKTRAEILNNLWYRFKRDRIKIPYPIQEEWEVRPEDVKKETLQNRTREEAEILEILTKIDIFSALPETTLKELAAKISVLQFAADEAVIRQGDSPGPMYIIKEGEVSVLVSQGEVARLGAGQFFGEMSVLTGAPRTATVKAVADITCYEIEKGDLQEIFATNPSALSIISEVLARRQAGLDAHKSKIADAAKTLERQGQLLSKIKAFFGL